MQTSNYAFGDQKPFREKVSGLPKAFNYEKFWEVSEGAGSPTLLNEFYCFSFFTNDQ